MKNRYLKGAHISERKVKELLKLFCEDLTATQIANITGISRITVNAYLKLLRTQIAQFSDEQNPSLLQNRSTFFYDFANGTSLEVQRPQLTNHKKPLYGIYKIEEKIYTEEIASLDPAWVHEWLKRKVVVNDNDPNESRLQVFTAIADFNSIKIYRTHFQASGNGKFRTPMDDIDLFWGLLKSRLIKFRGLNPGTLLLHVKETEFRYNNRSRELYDMLLTILHNRPLHFSRTA